MDILEATEDRLTKMIDGKERVLLYLSTYDRAELLRGDLKRRQEHWQRRRERLAQTLKDAGVEPVQVASELFSFDEHEPIDATEQDWIAFVTSELNVPTIVAKSLEKTYPGEGEALSREVALTLAQRAAICGLSMTTRGDAPSEDPDPNSQRPATYSTPAPMTSTGEGPQTS